MSMNEFRLKGRQASVSGVTRVIDRHLRGKTLRRVEVRYSTRTTPALPIADAKQAITALLREHGLSGVEISLRALELPIEDALGEHVVRLIHVEPEAAPMRAGGWLAWWHRWVAHRPGEAAQEPAGAAPPPEPDVAQRQAIELLQQALLLAVRAEKARAASVPIVGATITVRIRALHRPLQMLIAQDARNAGRWISQLLQQHGVPADAALAVRYAYLPSPVGEGTELAGGSDIEVQLFSSVPTVTPIASPGTLLPERSPAMSHEVSPDAGETLPATPRPALTVRVLGTVAERFAAPFELRFDKLPAHFDRAALEAAGFARDHAGMLRAVSQRCPLRIDRAVSGGLVVHAPERPESNGQAMYFRAETLAGLSGEVALQVKRQRLIVNGPNALVDPASQQRLQPLLIELALDDAEPGTRLAMAA